MEYRTAAAVLALVVEGGVEIEQHLVFSVFVCGRTPHQEEERRMYHLLYKVHSRPFVLTYIIDDSLELDLRGSSIEIDRHSVPQTAAASSPADHQSMRCMPIHHYQIQFHKYRNIYLNTLVVDIQPDQIWFLLPVMNFWHCSSLAVTERPSQMLGSTGRHSRIQASAFPHLAYTMYTAKSSTMKQF